MPPQVAPPTLVEMLGIRSFSPHPAPAAELWGLLAALGAREPGLVGMIRDMVVGDAMAARNRAATLLLVTLRPWPIVAKDIAAPLWRPLRLMVPVVMRADDRNTLLAVLPIAAASAVSRTAVPRWLVAEQLVEVRDDGMLAALVSIEFSDSVAAASGGVIATDVGIAPFDPTALQLPATDIFKVALWWG